MKPFLLFFLSSLGLFAVAATQPDPNAILIKDWQQVESDSVCQVQTVNSQGPFAAQLVLNFPKTKTAPPSVQLKVPAQATKASVALVKMTSKVSHPLFLETAVEGSPQESYLYLPLDLPKLVSNLRNQEFLDLVLDPRGTPIRLRISLRGANAAFEKAVRCLKPTALLPTEFLKLLNEKIENLPASPIVPPTMTATWQAVIAAYSLYEQTTTTKQALTAIRAQMKPLLAKETAANKVYQPLDQKLTQLNEKILSQQQSTLILQNEVFQGQTDLALMQTEQTNAEANLLQKTNVYKPLLARMAPYENEIAKAKRTLAVTTDEVDDLLSVIAANPRKIAAEQNQQARLRREISDLESSISSARREFEDRENKYRSYNVDWEARRILQSDFSYSNARNEIDRARHDERQAHSERNSAQSELGSAQSALSSCRSQSHDPAQPPPSCSSEESRVNSAQGRVRDAEFRCSQAQSRISSAESEMSRAESNAQNQASSISSGLQRDRDEAESRLRSLQSSQDQAEGALSSSERSEANLRAQLSRARSRLPGAQAAQNQAEADLQAAQLKRDNFSNEIGFGVAETEYRQAQDRLGAAKKSVLNQTALIAKWQKTIKSLQTETASLQKQTAKLQPQRDAAFAKLETIQTELKPSREQESAILATLDQQTKDLDSQRKIYQVNARDLQGAL